MRVPGTKRLQWAALAAALIALPAGASAQDEPMREPPPPAPLPQRVRPPAIPLEQKGAHCECPAACPGTGGSGASEAPQQGIGQVPENQSVHEGGGGAKRESQPPPEP